MAENDPPSVSETANNTIESLRNDQNRDTVWIDNETCPRGDVDVDAILNVIAETPRVTQMLVNPFRLYGAVSESSRNRIANYFSGSHHLKHVIVAYGDVSSLLDGISRGPGVESLEVSGSDMRTCASSFSNLIRSTTSLKMLCLNCSMGDLSAGDTVTLQNACRVNQSLQELKLLYGDQMPHLSNCLIQSCSHSLKKLELSNFRNVSVSALCGLLMHSKSLTDLALEFTDLSRRDCENIIESLRVNSSLHCLELRLASISDGAYDLVGGMIRAARSLQCVDISYEFYSAGVSRGKNALDAMIQGLEDNLSVRQVGLMFRIDDPNTADVFRPLLAGAAHVERLRVTFLGSTVHNGTTDLALALQENRSLLSLHVRRYSNCLDVLTEGLWRNQTLKSLHLDEFEMSGGGVVLPAGTIHELRRNFTITKITYSRRYIFSQETREIIDSIVTRNQQLESVDYGFQADSKMWPTIIHLFLRNDWVGPSLVFRLFTLRPEEFENNGD